MLEIIDETEVAKRKKYRFSPVVSARMIKQKKDREKRRKDMAKSIIKIDTLTEFIPDDIDTIGDTVNYPRLKAGACISECDVRID